MLWVETLLVIAALLLLFVGGEALVRGAASLALRAGLTPLMVGLTVVAFGTSSPELVVSIKSSIGGQGDIAVGNVLGSNIFNIAFILALTAIICPISVKSQIIKLDTPLLIAASLAFPLLLIDGLISRFEGSLLVFGILAYTIINFVLARKSGHEEVAADFEEEVPNLTPNIFWDIALLIGGIIVLVYGSRLLVDNAVIIAKTIGMSEAVIGITIVAAGTSAPELVTCIVAAVRRHPDIAVGNVIGSSIFNLLAVLGFSASVYPIASRGINIVDLVVMIGVTVILLPLMWTGMKLRRLEGWLLLGIFTGYMVWVWPK